MHVSYEDIAVQPTGELAQELMTQSQDVNVDVPVQKSINNTIEKPVYRGKSLSTHSLIDGGYYLSSDEGSLRSTEPENPPKNSSPEQQSGALQHSLQRMIQEELLDDKCGVNNHKVTPLSTRVTPYSKVKLSHIPCELTTIRDIKQDLDQQTLNDMEILEEQSHRTASLKLHNPSASKKRHRDDAHVDVLKDITSKLNKTAITDNAEKPKTLATLASKPASHPSNQLRLAVLSKQSGQRGTWRSCQI